MEGLVKCSLALQGNASNHFNVERRKSILKHLKKDLKPLAEAEFQGRGSSERFATEAGLPHPDRSKGCVSSSAHLQGPSQVSEVHLGRPGI